MRAIKVINKEGKGLLIPINAYEKYKRQGYELVEGEKLDLKESIKADLKDVIEVKQTPKRKKVNNKKK